MVFVLYIPITICDFNQYASFRRGCAAVVCLWHRAAESDMYSDTEDHMRANHSWTPLYTTRHEWQKYGLENIRLVQDIVT